MSHASFTSGRRLLMQFKLFSLSSWILNMYSFFAKRMTNFENKLFILHLLIARLKLCYITYALQRMSFNESQNKFKLHEI